MTLAIQEARNAAELDEVPVGAVILKGDEVLGRGHNRTRIDLDPTAHAEMVAIRDAADRLHSWRLDDCTLYVTLEPCAMCGGAIVLSRMSRLVFGASDPKAGACGSLRNVVADSRLNHRVDVVTGLQSNICSELLSSFFEMKRKKQADK
jgi:tRNA(adenine34) deaminase